MFLVKDFYYFFCDLLKSRNTIYELTKRDFKSSYLGSYLGLLWAFVNPTISILIFWFVFEVGFKSMPVAEFPFILWLMAGMIPWFFFSESISGATNSVTENSFMVKKVAFRVSVLPIVKILSALCIHLFFIFIVFLMFLLYGYIPNVYNFQVLYYLFSAIIFILGFSWVTSSLVIFIKDVSQVVGMLLQFGFWMTPIFWSLNIIPTKYQNIIKLNPAYYLIEGYRDSFINRVWFWEHSALTIYFWAVTLFILFFGAFLFRKLRPHFADVL